MSIKPLSSLEKAVLFTIVSLFTNHEQGVIMTLGTIRTDLILPKINAALFNAGLPAVQIQKAVDDILFFHFSNGERFQIKESDSVMPSTLHKFLESMQFEKHSIFLFPFISDTMACELSKRNINYADTAGNMYLQLKNGIIHIRNCAKPQEIKEAPAVGRCFAPSGLKMLFTLLTEKDALQWNYRKIAEQSGISLGSVRYVMADLLRRKFVLKSAEKLYCTDVPLLQRLWAENYSQRLLPKIRTLRYTGKLSKLYDDTSLVFSGESVAKKDKLLSSENVLLWKQTDNISRTILKDHLHRDDNGNIEIREAFWPTKIKRYTNQVPWLLVYADLLATEDGRCIEIAEEIKKRYLKDKL